MESEHDPGTALPPGLHARLETAWNERKIVKHNPASGEEEAFADEVGVVIKFDDREEAQPLGGEGVGVIRAMKDFALREHAQTIEPHVTIVQGMYAGQERQNLLLQIAHLRSLLACIPLSERTLSFSTKLVPHRPGGNLFLDVEGATCAFPQAAAAGEETPQAGFTMTDQSQAEWTRRFSSFTQLSAGARKCAGFVDLLTEFLCCVAPPSGPLIRDVSKILHDKKLATVEFQPGGMWRFGNVISEQTKANRAHITALYGNTQAEVVAQANRQVQEAVVAAGLEESGYRAVVRPEMLQLWTIDAKGNLGERVAENVKSG